MPLVTLKSTFMYQGKMYGPGQVEIKDQAIAESLLERQAEIDKKAAGSPNRRDGSATGVPLNNEGTDFVPGSTSPVVGSADDTIAGMGGPGDETSGEAGLVGQTRPIQRTSTSLTNGEGDDTLSSSVGDTITGGAGADEVKKGKEGKKDKK